VLCSYLVDGLDAYAKTFPRIGQEGVFLTLQYFALETMNVRQGGASSYQDRYRSVPGSDICLEAQTTPYCIHNLPQNLYSCCWTFIPPICNAELLGPPRGLAHCAGKPARIQRLRRHPRIPTGASTLRQIPTTPKLTIQNSTKSSSPIPI
jgi:hypothetical protein